VFPGWIVVASPSHFGREAVVTAPSFEGLPASLIRAAEIEDYDNDGREPNDDKVAGVA